MPKYEITSPDGKRFEVTAPDGATQEQVLQYAQSQFSAPEKPSALNRIGGAMIEGTLRGGPFAGPMRAFREIGNISQEGYDKFAYEGGGRATDLATRMGASPEVAAGAGYVTNVGLQAIPAIAGSFIGSAVGTPALQGTARSLMHSAIKPRIGDLRKAKVEGAVDTMLEQGISLSQGGINKLQSRITGLEDELSDILAKSPATVDKYAVGMSLRDAFSKVQKELSPTASMEKVTQALDDFLNHPLLRGSNQIPVELANQMKKAAYRKLGDAAYGAGVRNAATELSEKTLARGLKENIGRAVPEVGPLLSEQSRLINALKVMHPQALIEANKNPFGLGLLATNPQAAAAFAADRSGYLKSLIARGLYTAMPPAVTALGGLLGGQIAQPPP